MFRKIKLILLVCVVQNLFGQSITFDFDTLKYRHATLGDLDTLDEVVRPFASSFLFAESVNPYLSQPNQLFHPGNSIFSISEPNYKNLIFSALPHIGFGYSFGAQATQRLDFDYEQAFKHGFLINSSIHNFKTNGFFRNTNAQNSKYQVSLARNGKWHSFHLRANSQKVLRNWSGGIQNDSLVEIFSPELIPVWKENAESIHKILSFRLSNKFSLIQDSIRKVGFATNHGYSRFKRLYGENDSLSVIYSVVNLDSLKTNDSLLQQTVTNDFGLFYKSKNINLEGGVSSSYWNYQAFAYRNDTLETGIYSNIDLKMNKLRFRQNGNYNFIGASNGFNNSLSLRGNIVGLDFNVSHQVINELPSVFQRFFYSNNVAYKTVNLEKQWFQNLNAQVGRKFGNQLFHLSYEFGQFNKVYQFDSQSRIWRNDLNVSQGIYNQIQLKTQLNWRWLNGYFKYQYTAIEESKRFTPAHLMNARLFAKGGIFKAKKLKALAGIEFMLMSSYKRLNFVPQMTLFDLENSSINPISPGYMNLAAFASFEVETFRFYVRMDNLAYFWQNRQTEIVNGYAFPSTQLKVGITWDFWN
ncbi:MAG: putative porin [Bacteroidota bacterium]